MKYVNNGKEYHVEIIKKNNKNMYIRVKEDLTIQVTTSLFTSKREIERVLKDNNSAIEKMLNKRVNDYENNKKFYYLGKVYDIIYIPTISSIDMVDNYIYAPNEKMLNKWLNNNIETIFNDRYQYLYNQFKETIPYYRLRIRRMKTRHGVCNRSSKTVTLNSNLIKYDVKCLDYVIIHELSHLIHFDHSSNFWQLVFKYCPNYKEYRKIIK